MVQITNRSALDEHIALWFDERKENSSKPVGYILSLEGADSLVNLSYLEKAYANGLRICGPAHYGPGRYAPGTGEEGGLTALGKDLLKEMDALRMILDITHLTDKGFKEATDMYKGPIWASHHNCRKYVQHQRQLTDEQIKVLIERGAVIGGAFDTWMLVNNWVRGVDDPKQRNVYMELIIDHFDHICQLAGNTDHIAIGSDLDGAFGKEQSPFNLDTISDLQNLENPLKQRGYSNEDIENIFYKNWLGFLRNAWS
jgi:membrane dipeptidase